MKKRRSKVRILQSAALILAITCNFALGSLAAKKFTGNVPPLSVVQDVREPAPTVRIDGVRNGNLEGVILGDARLLVGTVPVLPQESGNFAVNASSVLVNHVSVSVPVGMHFVASKKGKYYYAVTSAKGSTLSPGNRVYFSTEAAAQAAGYRAP